MIEIRSMCRALTRRQAIPLVVLCVLFGQRAGAFERPEVLWQVGGHAGGISGVRFSPDGARIVTGSQDGTVKVWDVSSGMLELTVTMPYSFGSPSFPFYDASFNLDGSEIWAAGIGGGFCWAVRPRWAIAQDSIRIVADELLHAPFFVEATTHGARDFFGCEGARCGCETAAVFFVVAAHSDVARGFAAE